MCPVERLIYQRCCGSTTAAEDDCRDRNACRIVEFRRDARAVFSRCSKSGEVLQVERSRIGLTLAIRSNVLYFVQLRIAKVNPILLLSTCSTSPGSLAPAENCPCISPEFNNPAGVPISAIIFGGRRASTTPLVYQSFDWTHGTYMGSAVSSETTAAATGAVGVLRHDPMAMKPFIGYNVGDYWAHWLEMGKIAGDKAPKIFNVNWFKQDEEGNFLWPGFGDNMRVLDWIIKRCEGTVDAVETAIGYLPKKEDLNLTGIEAEVTPAVLDKLLAVDTDLWKKEIAEMRRYYTEDIAAKGGKVPAELMAELDKIEARLNK